MRDCYEILGVGPEATSGEIKRAFRAQIARYHPDKVQHLGKEFQELAEERAAELTAAYTTLSDSTRRSEYDRERAEGSTERPPHAQQAGPGEEAGAAAQPAAETPGEPAGREPRQPDAEGRRRATDPAFAQEQTRRDELVRRVSLNRFREACREVLQTFDSPSAAGFEVSYVGKGGGLLGRLRARPWVLGRYLPRVDGDTVRELGESAARLPADAGTRCVFLLSSQIARSGDVPEAVSSVRRHAEARYHRQVTVVPIDVGTWQSYLPKDAPAIARSILGRLR